MVPHDVQRRLDIAKNVAPEIPNKDRLDCGTLGGFMDLRFDDHRYIDNSWKSKLVTREREEVLALCKC